MIVYEHDDESSMPQGLSKWLLIGFAVIFLGIIVIVVASIVLSNPSNVGVVIFVGPIPIVFGKGPDLSTLLLIGIAITIISVAIFVIMNKRYKY